MDVLEILTKKGLINEADIPSIERLTEDGSKSIEEVLAMRGISSSDILSAKGEFYNIPTKEIENASMSFDVLKYIPEKSVKYYKIAPIGITDGVLEVGFVDPDNLEAKDAVQFIASKNNIPYKIFLISEGDFEKILNSYSGITGEVGEALSELETELSSEEEQLSEELSKVKSKKIEGTRIIEDAPVTKIVATVLRYAAEGRASDIHIEPLDGKVRVRFRVDGTMNTSLILPSKVLDAVVARIKILAKLKLDEKRKPQDGRFSAHIDNRKIDFRVSTFPTYYGEKVVMRLLDSERGVPKLDEMGIRPDNLKLIKDAIKRPFGLVLISGPTGSGKTTTLYSMLNEVDRDTKNVLSLEDPVEYNVSGISQSQIHPEIGYTFANGLRTTLRQDPDIIMVGEIRDKETAGLAIQAALTGHLVLSTIHTNSSIGVIPRLIDMGVDPYLIAPTLIIAMAQRLVKTICPNSGRKMPIEGSIKAILDNSFQDLPEKYRKDILIPEYVLASEGTPDCPNGTRGRTPVFEVLSIDRDIEEIILKKPNEVDIFNKAREKGMLTLKEDALLKAFDHKVPFEEINKL
ncbi:hypothetical protein COW81_02630 [Candidatus Campbellbacteria bacterium CG22_combo_CG10-13_8_21_14_all_36_13]|uniref:Bacterial type II secretion system protein E domain-containing protein n=1 Tax=Candidatus Campbellbacteria bacterium CG22_combo_CG10-13_8_21_14_all_36_13 TaxID=1974529 RepID=A0A2H0DXU0_9BACT|nr:MAG: hypothetical protein COW81_02630 [Candidatus Campbellbacteria bacterium CG22_combo_CG10-13_8_21_14_all_36_13]